MALVRSWAGDPTFPVILIADLARQGLTPGQRAQFDQYVGAQLAIAQSDSNVLVINSRRLMENLGRDANSASFTTFVADCCHYTPYGARVLAAAGVAAMLGQLQISGCASDQSNLTLQSTADLTLSIGGTTACSCYRQFTVAQALTLDQPILDVVLRSGFGPNPVRVSGFCPSAR